MVARIGRQTVTLVRRERNDLEGDPAETGARVVVDGCFVEPRDSGGTDEGSRRALSRFRIYGPEPLRTVGSYDLVEVDGWLVGVTGPGRCNVAGRPAVWPNMRGGIDHVELDITYAATTG